MSSKKKYTTVGLVPELFYRLQEEAEAERRSKGFIIEKILREYYKMPWERNPEHSKKGDS